MKTQKQLTKIQKTKLKEIDDLISKVKQAKFSFKTELKKNDDKLNITIEINDELKSIVETIILKDMDLEILRLNNNDNNNKFQYKDTNTNTIIPDAEIFDYLGENFPDDYEDYQNGNIGFVGLLDKVEIEKVLIPTKTDLKRYKVLRVFYSELHNYRVTPYTDLIFEKTLIDTKKLSFELSNIGEIQKIEDSIKNTLKTIIDNFQNLNLSREFEFQINKND